MKPIKEISVCENHALLMDDKKYCSRCIGFDCRYLQSILEKHIDNYLARGYRWIRRR